MSSETPRVESFVLRFVADASGAGATAAARGSSEQSTPSRHALPGATPARWRGVVVHVQTNEEKSFTDFADAIAFIARYVPVGDFVLQGENDHAE